MFQDVSIRSTSSSCSVFCAEHKKVHMNCFEMICEIHLMSSWNWHRLLTSSRWKHSMFTFNKQACRFIPHFNALPACWPSSSEQVSFAWKGKQRVSFVSQSPTEKGHKATGQIFLQMVWIGRDLKTHPTPTPCHGQGHLPPKWVQLGALSQQININQCCAMAMLT